MAADLDHVDREVGAVERRAPVEVALDRRRWRRAARRVQRAIASAVSSRSGSMSCSAISTSASSRKREQVAEQVARELDAAGSDEGDARHGRWMFSQKACRCTKVIETGPARSTPVILIRSRPGREGVPDEQSLEAGPRALSRDRPPAQPRADRERRPALPRRVGRSPRSSGRAPGSRSASAWSRPCSSCGCTRSSTTSPTTRCSRRAQANARWGHLLGFLLFTPYRWWQRQHAPPPRATPATSTSAAPGEIYTMTARRVRERLARCGGSATAPTATRC